jgi:serine/threonine protein kinase
MESIRSYLLPSLRKISYTTKPDPVVPYDFQFDPDDPQFNEPRDPKYIMEREFLGDGQFGAVFMPAFPSVDGREHPSMIGKVFYDPLESQKEWRMIQRINHLTGNLAYPIERNFIPFPSNPRSGAEEDLKTFFIERTGLHDGPFPEKLPQHLMRYYGINLEEYAESIGLNVVSRIDFVKLLESLFWGVKFLNGNGIIHQDIKPKNIVISSKKGLRIIDFGWAILESDYYDLDKNDMLTINYPGVSPPENCVLQFILNNLTFESLDYDKINEEFVVDYQDNYLLLDPNNKEFTDQFLDKLKIFVNPLIRDLKQDLKDSYAFKGSRLNSFLKVFIKLMVAGELHKWREYPDLARLHKDDRKEIYQKIIVFQDKIIGYWKENRIGDFYDIFSVGMVINRILQRDILISEKDDNPQAVRLFKELVSGITRYSPLHRMDSSTAHGLVQQIKLLKPTMLSVLPDESPESKLRLQQFGSVNLKAINRDIFYLKGFK